MTKKFLSLLLALCLLMANPYKPTKDNGKYELSDEFAALLHNAAHG